MIVHTQARSYSPANRTAEDITLVVIHTAECAETDNAAENVAKYFAGSNSPKASAHYTVDNDSVTQSVLEKDVAWHAGPVNGYSIGVEHAGSAKRDKDDWKRAYSVNMLGRSAELVAGICRRYNIPVQRVTAEDLKKGKRSGICGHIDVTSGLQGGRGHWDPGPHFPWDAYLQDVRDQQCADEPVGGQIIVDLDEHARALRNAHPDLVPVKLRGETWLVSPVYWAPVGIGEAVSLAEGMGYELPSPALVDAIWEQADLKVEPLPRKHDGSIAQMATEAVYLDQGQRIERQIGATPFRLLAGVFKDVVRREDGKIGLYGWHRKTGAVIQPFYSGHSLAWRDYSQGLRLVKRA